jgi:S-adenosylmethionine:tRNA ribosyltransferase-isomerase
MKITKFDYSLPHELIAQKPANPRDSSRLFTIDRTSEIISHKRFFNLLDILNKNDVLVFNKSKVFPARIFGQKKTKGKVEVLILKFLPDSVCEVITKPGMFLNDIICFDGFFGRIIKRDGYITHIVFDLKQSELLKQIEINGKTPIPPYIESKLSEKDLRMKYQTVYAKKVGSSAAPTAGLHFTKELIKKLKKKGVQMEFVTLHVGLGTFAPVKENEIEKHRIHEEYFEVDEKTINRLNNAKKNGKRIVAVGTTTTRVLETLANPKGFLNIKYKKQHTNLFIFPPFEFKFVDALITNFHLPKSTLLALTAAFTAYPNTQKKFTDLQTSVLGKAYEEAVRKEYRFFSFGDAMFIS